MSTVDEVLMDIMGFGSVVSCVAGIVWAVVFRAKRRGRR